MTPELDRSLASAVEALKNGAIDLQAQFPELAQQIVAREMVGGWIGIAISVVLLILAAIAAIAAAKSEDGIDSGWAVCSFVSGMTSLIAGGINGHTVLICHYAPKTVVLEQVVKLLH